MSPIVRRALLRFHRRRLDLRLESGEDPGRIVDDFLRDVLPLLCIEDLRPLLDAIEKVEPTK